MNVKRKRIVTIGGGTGSFTLLSGLKKYSVYLSAIVSMADDGGSTGRLRDELGVLPPGDVRQCLVALSQSSETMRELMNYRFESGDLKGHSFGNIFISALEKTCGSLSAGICEATEILKIQGEILPVTEDDMRLSAELENGKVLYGEDALDDDKDLRKNGVALKKIGLQRPVRPNARALRRIGEADAIILGPGDQFGSTIPNLLVPGIAEAIEKSKAKVIFVVPLTNKKGLTSGWDVDRYVRSLEKYLGKGKIDYVIYNTKDMDSALVEQYEEQEEENSVVKFNERKNGARSYKLVQADVLHTIPAVQRKGDALAITRSFIRHDSDKLARVILPLVESNGNI